MNVLSLFDGMSCGQIALNKLGIEVNKYYAAEIDKYAMQVTKKNFPNTIHLGNVLDVGAQDLEPIDLLIGGSPCQGFSFAGKQLNFEDPRSKLFFEFVRLLRECKPKYFLLENVKMKKEFQDVISNFLEVGPIEINSALVSAQNRKRLYWTNIPNVNQPEDKNLNLRDILQNNGDNFEYLNIKKSNYLLKLASVDNKTRKEIHNKRIEFPKELKINVNSGDFIYSNHLGQNGIISKPKAATLTLNNPGNVIDLVKDQYLIRKLTPLECERLQTVPDNYTEGVSNSQRYKMLGNGWTVDVIGHIFKGIEL